MVLNLKKFSKNEFQEFLEKNSSIVEEISNLKPNIDLSRIHLYNRLKFLFDFQENPLKNYRDSFLRFGGYRHSYPPHFYFPGKYFGNLDSLNLSFCHEIFHNAQYVGFPDLFIQTEILGETNNKRRKQTKEEKDKFHSIKKLVEGDAKLVENICKKEYYPNPKRDIPKWVKYFNNSVVEKASLEGENILLGNFGGKRKKINGLYDLPINEIHRIFS